MNSGTGTTQLGGFPQENIATLSHGGAQGIEKQEDCMKFVLRVTPSCAGILLRVMGGRWAKELENGGKTYSNVFQPLQCFQLQESHKDLHCKNNSFLN